MKTPSQKKSVVMVIKPIAQIKQSTQASSSSWCSGCQYLSNDGFKGVCTAKGGCVYG